MKTNLSIERKGGVLNNSDIADLLKNIESGKMLVINNPFKSNLGAKVKFFYLKGNKLIEVTSSLSNLLNGKCADEIVIRGVGFDRIGFFLSLVYKKLCEITGRARKRDKAGSFYWYECL